MTDLTATCPGCGATTTNYFHKVDHFGMGISLNQGEYNMRCVAYKNTEKPQDFCGRRFRVKLEIKEVVTVVNPDIGDSK